MKPMSIRYSRVLFSCLLVVWVGGTAGCTAPGRCLTNTDCRATHYCARPEGECDAEGACRERPEACIELYAPVCGCDGQTYSNDCYAAMAGVSVAHEGPCAGAGG